MKNESLLLGDGDRLDPGSFPLMLKAPKSPGDEDSRPQFSLESRRALTDGGKADLTPNSWALRLYPDRTGWYAAVSASLLDFRIDLAGFFSRFIMAEGGGPEYSKSR